jgi:hypothetical protein
MAKLFESIVEFMMRSGMAPTQIEGVFKSSIDQVNKRSKSKKSSPGDSSYVGNGNVSAEIIRVWHREERFLDSAAKPRSLALTGGQRSLSALIRTLDPSSDVKTVIAAMRAVGLIRRLRSGRYIPTAESVTIDHLHPLAIEHVAKSVMRLVATVSRNTDSTRQSGSLIERYAYVPDLNRTEAAAFAKFTHAQGMSCLEAMDDWLEQRRVRRLPLDRQRSAGLGITAGVHLVAYLGDKGIPATKVRESRDGIPLFSCDKLPRQLKRPRRPTLDREAHV